MQEGEDERGFFAEVPASPGRVRRTARRPRTSLTTTATASGCASAFARTAPTHWPTTKLLELMLFRTIPTRRHKAPAKALLKRFGSFAEVLGAPEHPLARGRRDWFGGRFRHQAESPPLPTAA